MPVSSQFSGEIPHKGRAMGFLLRVVAALTAVWTFEPVVRADEADARIQLTEAERAWIQANPVVYFSYDPGWGPFSYRDENGEFGGIDRDFLELLSKRLGLRFEAVHARSWPEAYEGARSGAADFLVGTLESAERALDFLFTRPYNSFPMAFVARYDSETLLSPGQLEGKRVAMVEGYLDGLAFGSGGPRVRRVMVKTINEAFLAVSAGRADVAVTNVANANHVIKSLGLANLKVAGVIPYVFDLRYAVNRDKPVLRDILDKGVASLSTKDKHDIVGQWVHVEYTEVIRWDHVVRWIVAAVVFVCGVIGVIVWHNRGLRRELDQRIRVQSELESTKARLEALNEERSGMMRMAAHDLRNPLNGLMLNVEILRETATGEEREIFDRMLMLVHQMIHMISNLLDVQAIEDGRRRLCPEPVEVAPEVEGALASMQAMAERKRIEFSTWFAGATPPVQADRAALRQVLNNLVSNAVKYSPHGRLVSVEAEPSPAGCVVVRVRDQGPGIKPEDMPRLFQKYACLSARPTGGEQSTGLGLAIVKQLVTAMGGTVRCEENPGGGAVFVLELPAAGAAFVSGPGCVPTV